MKSKNKIEEPEAKDKWPKSISVDKRIVRILSESTYENFPRALKELLTNSYDADAREVDITIDLPNEQIIVEDNGKGMDSTDFSFYIRIAGKKREKDDNTTILGRDIIGQFGVGFLAIFPFFKTYKIESKKSGSTTLLYADIPLYKYFSDENKAVDLHGIVINGGKREVTDKNRSYTRIVLTGFNELTKSFFYSKAEELDKSKTKKETRDGEKDVRYKTGIEQLKWTLSEDLPIHFKNEKFNKIFGYEALPFQVFINGSEIYRNSYGDSVLETHKGEFHQIGKIKCKYFIATPQKLITLRQGRYYKIRNLNVGIGDRDDFGLDSGEGSHNRWLYGEIHIIEGLNNLIKVSRDGFNFSSDYEALKQFFQSKLRHYSTKLGTNARFQKEVKQTGKQFRVSNLKLLPPENLTDRLENFKKEGYQIKKTTSESNKGKPIKINEELKEIYIDKSMAGFEKSIIVNNITYRVLSDKWDYKKDDFPACKVHGKTITLNQDYPLFSSAKYTDIFVKLNLLLAINYVNKKIEHNTFKLLSNDILEYYSDYLK